MPKINEDKNWTNKLAIIRVDAVHVHVMSKRRKKNGLIVHKSIATVLEFKAYYMYIEGIMTSTRKINKVCEIVYHSKFSLFDIFLQLTVSE